MAKRKFEPRVGEQEWERLWFTLRGKPWAVLAVVGTRDGADALQAVQTLESVGRRDGRLPVHVVSAVGLSYEAATTITARLQEAAAASAERALTLVACDPVHSYPAMIPVIQASSAVMFVVRLGDTALGSLKTAIELAGRDKVLATVSIG